MKSQKSVSISPQTSGSLSEVAFPYQAGLKIQALISKLRQEKRPLSDLFQELEDQAAWFQDQDEFLKLQGIASALCDLFANGWDIDFQSIQSATSSSHPNFLAQLLKPEMLRSGETIEAAKARAREGLLLGVKANLTETSTQKFITSMEKFGRNKLPIQANLFDDPRNLALDLRRYQEGKLPLRKVFDPYIQFVEEGQLDEHSGRKLSDIWRYCRLTWSMEYKTNPGRSIRILIRNKARHGHPIIGIAMLASPVIALSARDDALGLTYDAFLEFLKKEKITLPDLILMMRKTFHADSKLIDKKGLTLDDSIESISSLLSISEAALVSRKNALEYSDKALAEDLLFLSKRALKLYGLEKALKDLKLLEKQTKKERLKLQDVDENKNFVDLVKKYLTQKRAEVISSDIMDVSVCGAVFPYNSLLAGKLTALLMASDEVKDFIDKKYSKTKNIITSKMAGRDIFRPTNLIGLTTTSLYGVGSSQYNRLKLNKENSKINKPINWQELASTKGYGTFHFSKRTKDLVGQIDFDEKKFQHVNYNFGEGASPAMRRIKSGLALIGFDENVIQHEFKRKTYLCDLTKNIKKEIFLDKSQSLKLNNVSQITKAWQKRFFDKRIANKTIINDLAKLKKAEYLLSTRYPKKDDQKKN